jgi:hypothetical protein
MVSPDRLIKPQDKFRESFPGLNFPEVYSFRISGESVLVTDPLYLADVYNSKDDIASFVREHGVLVMDFGGDVSCPVLWQSPFVLLPISMHLSGQALHPPEGSAVLANEVGTDSGSFVFLPLAKEVPPVLKAQVDRVVAESNGAILELPAGDWSVFYEQWDAPESSLAKLYRNIVLKWESSTKASGREEFGNA